MAFEEYKEKLGEKFTLSYEHEKDYMNWEASVIEYRFLKDEKIWKCRETRTKPANND